MCQLAGAAHDLKQSVEAMRLHIELMGLSSERCAELMHPLLQCADAVADQVSALFDYATMNSARFEPVPRQVSVQALLGELHARHQLTAQRKGLSLHLRLPAQAGALDTDPLLMGRILDNLLANAIEYTDAGWVLLAARRWGQGLALEAWDTGPGLTAQAQQQMFEPFVRGPQVLQGSGTGLGLSIVRALSERLGYRVAVRSRPGVGSLFRVLTGPIRSGASPIDAPGAAPGCGC